MAMRVGLFLATSIFLAASANGIFRFTVSQRNDGPKIWLALNWDPYKCPTKEYPHPIYRVSVCTLLDVCVERSATSETLKFDSPVYRFTNYRISLFASCMDSRDKLLSIRWITTPPGELMPPEITNVNSSKNSVTVSWKPHPATIRVASYFVLRICRRTGLDMCRSLKIDAGPSTEVYNQTVTQIASGVEYDVKLQTVTKSSPTEEYRSAVVSQEFVTGSGDEDKFPSVRNVTAKLNSNGTWAIISFEKPLLDDNWTGSIVKVVTERGLVVYRPIHLGRESLSATIGPVPPFSHLRAEVQAIYSHNNMTVFARPAIRWFTTQIGDLPHPEIMQLSAVSSTAVLIVWSHEENDSVDFEYAVHLKALDASNSSELLVSEPDGYSTIYNGLRAETTYTVWITASTEFKERIYNITSKERTVTTLATDSLKPVVSVNSVQAAGISISWQVAEKTVMQNCTFSVYVCGDASWGCRRQLDNISWVERSAIVLYQPLVENVITVETACRYFDGTSVLGFNSSEVKALAAFVPSAVEKIELVNATESDLNLYLVSDEAEAEFVTGYLVSWSELNARQPFDKWQTSEFSEREISIKSLKPLTAYNISARAALNLKNGTILQSLPVFLTISTSHPAPGAVGNLHVQQVPDTFLVQAEWNAPPNPQTDLEYHLDVFCNTSKFTWTWVFRQTKIEFVVRGSSDDLCVVTVTPTTASVTPEKWGPSTNATVRFRGLKRPVAVKVIEVHRGFYTFEITPPPTASPANFTYQLYHETAEHAESWPDNKVKMFFLDSYSEHQLVARVCIEKFCGDPYRFQFTTNTAEPGHVRDLIAKTVNVTGVAVSWTEPAVRHGPIDGYHIRVVDWETKSMSAITQSGHSTRFTFEADKEYALYSVSVQAFNYDLFNHSQQMNGPFLSVKVLTGGRSAPPPSTIEVLQTFDSSLEVRWHPSELQTNVTTIGYRVRYQLVAEKTSDATLVQDVPAPSDMFVTETHVILDHLLPCSNYSVAVASCSSRTSCGRSLTNIFTTAVSAPNAPKGLTVLQQGASSIVVEWSAPVEQLCPIDGYAIVVCPESATPCPLEDDWQYLEATARKVTLNLDDFELRWGHRLAKTVTLRAYSKLNSGSSLFSTTVTANIHVTAGGSYVVGAVISGLLIAVAVVAFVMYRKGWQSLRSNIFRNGPRLVDDECEDGGLHPDNHEMRT